MPIFYFKQQPNDVICVNNTAYDMDRGDLKLRLEKGCFYVNVFKTVTEDSKHFLPLNAVINVLDDDVSVIGALSVSQINGCYLVEYELDCLLEYCPPIVLLKQTAQYNGSQHVATLVKDSKTRLLLEGGGCSLTIQINHPISNPKMQLQQTSLGLLTALSARCGDKKYVLIAIFDGEYKKLFETVADKIDFKDNSFTVSTVLFDMLRRTKNEFYVYDKGGFKLKATTFEYAHLIPYPTALLPCLLLEAVAACDYNKAKEYLDQDLGEPAYLADYLGAFDDFCAVQSAGLPDCFTLTSGRFKRGLHRPKRVKFEIVGKKITNINLI